MKLRRLEMKLEEVADFQHPSPALEQYMTPAPLAARIVHHAFLAGDIEELTICDLGCGTGILGIGAALLGAAHVDGYDCDRKALKICSDNTQKLSVVLNCHHLKLEDEMLCLQMHYDTVLMNPPFGAQNAHADRPFIDCALAHADVVYGIFNAGSVAFLERYTKKRATIRERFHAMIPLRRSFPFHTKEVCEIPVEVLIFDVIKKRQ
ncbi:MAG: METTL5 family protein [Euryarchaeota archaeon]|nr:METTL5 family protein [Euryarchaeota archaeon]